MSESQYYEFVAVDRPLALVNWGTHRIILRLPIGLLDPAAVATYCAGGSASSWTTEDHVLLDLFSEDESGGWDEDDEGQLGSIAPVRAELAAGDARLLYLAWLLRRLHNIRGQGRAVAVS
jgi:hypothetical protein